MTIRKISISYCLLLMACLFFSSASAQSAFRVTPTSVIGYLEYLPQNYNNNSDKYPVVIFLHGLGERGPNTTDFATLQAGISTIERHGIPKHVKSGTSFPFIAISPQLKNNYGDWPTSYVMEVIDYCKTYLRIDERRIYLTGLSLGGGGTWNTAQDFPKLFAAIAPVCGSRNSTGKAPLLVAENLPVWAFHGDADGTVPLSRSVAMVNAINACIPAPSPFAKLTIYPGVGHNAWDNAYRPDRTIHNPNVYDWMMSYTNTVNASNKIPLANAGADKIVQGSNQVITGSGSDTDGSITAYSWVKIAGPGATLANANTPGLSLSNLSTGVYVFRLRVTDNTGNSDSDYIKLTVASSAPAALPPVVSAGSDKVIVLPTNTATIVGSATDSDGTVVSYQWIKISGGAATLTNATSPTLLVSSLLSGSYLFRLTATDNNGLSQSDDMTLTINGGVTNIAPVASAGPDRTVKLPVDRITLFGVGSDVDGSVVSYQWIKVSGGACTISNPSVSRPTLTNVVPGVYVFRITVTDDDGAFSSDEIIMTIVNSAGARLVNNVSDETEIDLTESESSSNTLPGFILADYKTEMGALSASIFDEHGSNLFQGVWTEDSYSQIFNKTGLYIYHVLRDGKKQAGKIYITQD